MGLAEVQRMLAHLYTDVELRRRFIADPIGVGRELGLTADESRQLAELSPEKINSFADSLQAKRLLEVGKLLPMTNRTIGDEFSRHFKRFAGTYSPAGIKKHLGDALAFATYLQKQIRSDSRHAGWVLDLLRYERARLKAADPSIRLVVCVFRYDISRLVRSVARREATPTVQKRLTCAVWWRPQRRGMVRYAVMALPGLPHRLR